MLIFIPEFECSGGGGLSGVRTTVGTMLSHGSRDQVSGGACALVSSVHGTLVSSEHGTLVFRGHDKTSVSNMLGQFYS